MTVIFPLFFNLVVYIFNFSWFYLGSFCNLSPAKAVKAEIMPHHFASTFYNYDFIIAHGCSNPSGYISFIDLLCIVQYNLHYSYLSESLGININMIPGK